MGWANCGVDRDGRPIGYAVSATCDWPGCDFVIDRGLSYLCGEMHQDGESCNGYFCADHMAGIALCLLCNAWRVMAEWDSPCDYDCGECAACLVE